MNLSAKCSWGGADVTGAQQRNRSADFSTSTSTLGAPSSWSSYSRREREDLRPSVFALGDRTRGTSCGAAHRNKKNPPGCPGGFLHVRGTPRGYGAGTGITTNPLFLEARQTLESACWDPTNGPNGSSVSIELLNASRTSMQLSTVKPSGAAPVQAL
jgi:hypothetical protein